MDEQGTKVMDQEIKIKAEEIMDGFQCPKDFQCYKSGFETLCKVGVGSKGVVTGGYVCLEERPPLCKFSVPFGERHFCQCPLRVFIFKELGK